MKLNDIKKLSKEQLFSELDKLKKEQFNIRFKKKSGQISNTSSIKNVRRTIARVKTFINSASKKNG